MLKVLVKDKSLKEYWEKELNCTLPENSEVWSKFQIKEETLNKINFNIRKKNANHVFTDEF